MKNKPAGKEYILECAQRVFSSKGFYEAQIFDISSMARVAKGTIYQHFRNKEHILLSLIEKYTKDANREIKTYCDDGTFSKKREADSSPYILNLIRSTIIFFEKNPERSRIILRLGPGLNNSIDPAIRMFEEIYSDLILKNIRKSQEKGYIDININPEITCTIVTGAILRICYHVFISRKEHYKKKELKRITTDIIKLTEKMLPQSATESHIN